MLLAVLLLLCVGPHSDAAAETDDWTETQLAPTELALAYGTASDAIDVAVACELMANLINAERRRVQLDELAWDALAGWTAQDYVEEMVSIRRPGHRDAAGRKCEQRFNLAGGTDHVSENFVYYEIEHSVYLTPQLVQRMHEHWLASPRHRSEMLGAEHTHLGCGFAVVQAEGRTYAGGIALFVNDYGEYESLAAEAAPGDTLSIRGCLDTGRVSLRYIGIAVEDTTGNGPDGSHQMERATYHQPPVLLALLPRSQENSYRIPVPYSQYVVGYDPGTGAFAVDLMLLPYAPNGVYYITAWVAPTELAAQGPAGPGKAFRAMTQVVLVTAQPL